MRDGHIEYMTVQAFHDLLKADTIQVQVGDNKVRKQLSQVWLASPHRATYDSIALLPEKEAPPGVLNLWQGFKVKPLAPNEKPTEKMIEGMRLFKEHALDNVCLGNTKLYNWLFGYLAHIIQKPWQKPLTALVFKGEKGVGKNALVDRIGNLLGSHYLLTSNRRYLTSNFNRHLSTLVLFVLDEAMWSGDKQAEGVLKDLITGNNHLIEPKGREMYVVRNLARIILLSNEDWVVSASREERRFAVFNVGNERRQDGAYFKKMRKLLDNEGGNRLLMRELLDFDLKTINVNDAPQTIGLLEQKIETLNPVHSWWLSSLKEGIILQFDFSNDAWPKTASRERLRAACNLHAKERGVRSWLPDAAAFGRELSKCMPNVQTRRLTDSGTRQRVYLLPALDECRSLFDKFIGHELEWEDQESNVIDLFS